MSVKVQKITEPLVLGEGPHWDGDQQALYFVSITEHTIHKYVPATGQHTRTKLGERLILRIWYAAVLHGYSVAFIQPVYKL